MNDKLWAWLSGTLSGDETRAFEERLFEDEALARDAALACSLRDALRAMSAEGPLTPVVTKDELRALAQHARITEHTPRDGAITTCIKDEAFVAAHVPLTSAPARVDVLFCLPDGAPYFRVNEAPFDPRAGEVIILCQSHVALATSRLVVKVVDEHGALLAEVPIENHA